MHTFIILYTICVDTVLVMSLYYTLFVSIPFGYGRFRDIRALAYSAMCRRACDAGQRLSTGSRVLLLGTS